MKLTPEQLQMAPRYFAEAQAYLRSLPLEHFMEATCQGTQRKITLASLELVSAQRPEVQVFNELLVMYPRGRKIEKVVPDNMVVLWDQPIEAEGSYEIPLQPVGPFWVLEYVLKSSPRKDYEHNVERYERLKVPYYLSFYPETQDLTLRQLNANGKYIGVLENERGRLAIPELEIEIALLDEWARFWFRGELLPMPGDLLRDLQHERELREKSDQRAMVSEQRADAAEKELEVLRERLRQLEAQKNGSP